MAVPLFNRFVLSHYERTRPEAATELLSLQEMTANAGLDPSASHAGGDMLRLSEQNETRQLPPPSGRSGRSRSRVAARTAIERCWHYIPLHNAAL